MSFNPDSLLSSVGGTRGNEAWRVAARPFVNRRGGGGGGFSSKNHTSPQSSLKPLGPAIDSINIDTLLIEEQAPKVENVQYVSSYNWLDDKSPIILVPGQSIRRRPYLIEWFPNPNDGREPSY